MSRSVLYAIIIILIIVIIGFLLANRKQLFIVTPTPTPTTSVVSPTVMPSGTPMPSVISPSPTVHLSPTRGITPSPTTY